MGTSYKGSKEDTQALNTFIKLFRSYEKISSSVREKLAEENLTISQFGVLETLFHLGPMCQNDIAKKLLKSSGNITTVIDNLEKKNLIQRTPLPEDRRYYLIKLTKQGKSFISQYFPEHVKLIHTLMSPLTLKEQTQLDSLLKKLGKANNLR